ncbi:MAG: PspA/IM30 family protein [Kofleriaceae bacterium]|jgi:phage shock protein A|nr:PspA/IM30 family protein [Kofleriaceae bacterium]MBP6837665.1 PspA/IM30 family protein [Kofleriaceae bacterium]MBP9206964.1 PspA/IM30 family protein [Kofleriaceae bacterium]
MGIFSRLGTLIKSNLNDLITKAEDPEKMLNQVLLEMEQQLRDAKKAVAVAIADEKKLQKQYNGELDKAKEWERKAMVAVRAGDDGLARQALVRKQEHETISGQFQTQWIAQKQAVEKLKDALRLLNNKIEEAKRKKNILIARKKRAEAQQQIASTMQGLGDTSAFDTFDRMSERIALMEAEAEAGAELAGELSGDTLDAKFLALESGGGASEDDALSELKAKMGLLEGPKGDSKQLGAGAGAASGDGKDAASSKGNGNGSSSASGSSLTAEDLKELEDLDLSEFDKDGKKA